LLLREGDLRLLGQQCLLGKQGLLLLSKVCLLLGENGARGPGHMWMEPVHGLKEGQELLEEPDLAPIPPGPLPTPAGCGGSPGAPC